LSQLSDADDHPLDVPAQSIGRVMTLTFRYRQAVVLEHAEMMRDQRLRQSRGLDDVRDMLTVLSEDSDNAEPVRVGEDGEYARGWLNGFSHINLY
jgi:hypothetical protein